MRHSFFLWPQSLLAVALHLPAAAADTALSLLPASEPVQAKVMQIGMPRSAQRTSEKIQAAFVSQPEWSTAFIANAVRGQPLPYHPNMQITKDEYRSFLAAAEKPVLVQVATVSLIVERRQDGSTRIITEPGSSKVNGLTIAPDESSVRTPLATLNEVTPINNEDKNGATGRWTGTQWRHVVSSPGHVLAVKLAIGKRTDHGDRIIYYDVKDVRDGHADVYYEVLLFPAAK